MSLLSPSDQDILRAIIAERGSAVIPTGSESAVEELLRSSIPSPVSGMKGLPMDPTGNIGYTAKTSNYRIDPRGNPVGDILLTGAELAGTATGKYNNAVNAMYKAPQLSGIARGVKGAGLAVGGRTGLRLAGSALKLAPALGAVGGVLGAADVIAGNDSFGNKAMDTVAMGIGGTLGAAGGPLGIAAGAGIGKAISDGAQFIFGGGKSAEQRKMEEALALLQGGRI